MTSAERKFELYVFYAAGFARATGGATHMGLEKDEEGLPQDVRSVLEADFEAQMAYNRGTLDGALHKVEPADKNS
jgi:hypothetical protein